MKVILFRKCINYLTQLSVKENSLCLNTMLFHLSVFILRTLKSNISLRDVWYPMTSAVIPSNVITQIFPKQKLLNILCQN